MEAEFDHSSLATSVTATERGRMRKNPTTTFKEQQASKQGRLHLHGMLHLFRAFFESASHAPLLMHKRGQKCL